MKKVVVGLILISLCALQSCRDDDGTENVLPLTFTIEVVDLEGHDLLDPSFKGNIVSQNPTMINLYGKEVGSTMYTDEDYLYTRGQGSLSIERRYLDDNEQEGFHFILPGGPYFYSFHPQHWVDDGQIIIKWGKGIENDTIVFSGGWKEDWYGPGISKISINGKELEKAKPQWSDDHYLYRKDMSSKN